ncbi:MAG: response regulator [Pseudomonadota bacterium]
MGSEVKPDQALANLRVLIVDDNAAMRGLVRAILGAFGCENVFEADGAKRAMEILRGDAIDLVISDWKMSPVDGIELVKIMRDPEQSPTPYMPVIMLTAYAEPSRVHEARDAGVTEFLAKPFSSENLYRRIQSIVNRPRPFVRTKVFFGPDRRRRGDGDYLGPERRDDPVI